MTTPRRRRSLGAVVALVTYALTRRWFLRWGAPSAVVAAELPGDRLLADPSLVTTRAIEIGAPVEAVWPWLVQMGQDRGGLYSYDWLENLVGLQFHNADRVVPDWQDLAVGDQIRAAPASSGPEAGFTVVSIEPARSIVTVVGDPARVLPAAGAPPMTDGATWAFVLDPIGEGATRLIVRLRARFAMAAPAAWVVGRLLEPIHFVMERKQLLGIRARAERARVDATRHPTRSSSSGVSAGAGR